MSTVLSRAKEIADAEKSKRQEADAGARADTGRRDAILQKLRALVLKALSELDGQQTLHGKLRVKRVQNDADGVIAYLVADEVKKVAWFKAGIVSGTFDASDDCRDIPFTEAR